MGFPTKHDHLVFLGYHHLRKPPYVEKTYGEKKHLQQATNPDIMILDWCIYSAFGTPTVPTPFLKTTIPKSSRFVSRLPGRQVSQTPNTALEVHPVAIPAEPEIDTLNVSGENLQPNMAMLLTTRQTGSFLDKKVCFC